MRTMETRPVTPEQAKAPQWVTPAHVAYFQIKKQSAWMRAVAPLGKAPSIDSLIPMDPKVKYGSPLMDAAVSWYRSRIQVDTLYSVNLDMEYKAISSNLPARAAAIYRRWLSRIIEDRRRAARA